jgi:hypothetical protein
MKVQAAITVSWWFGRTEFDGVADFKADLAENYAVSVVRGRQGPLGLGLDELYVQFLSHLSLKEVVTVLLEGVAYDLIKSGTNAFFIRPFLDAYKRFKARERNQELDIERMRFVFEDAAINIERLPNTDLLAELEHIFAAFAQNFEALTHGSKGRLFEVYVPIFEDKDEKPFTKFRTLRSVDETIDLKRISREDYFKFWGLQYYSEGSPACVYDVQRKLVIEEGFYTEWRPSV